MKNKLNKINLILSTFFILNSASYADSYTELNKLNNNQKELLEIKKDINEKEYEVNKNDWLNSINLKYNQNYTEGDLNNKNFTISVDQPIFKSGGIYNAIKYSKNNYEYNSLS